MKGSPKGEKASNKRMSKREAARRRVLRRRRVLYGGAAAAAVAAAFTAALVFHPAPFPDGITAYAQMHIHAHLRIFRLAANFTVPTGIGINTTAWEYHALDKYSLNGPKFAPIHTHDTTGTIHIESTVTRPYTLGEFFLIWNQPFNATHVLGFRADYNHTLSMRVNGQNSTAWNGLVFEDQQQIEVHWDNITQPSGV